MAELEAGGAADVVAHLGAGHRALVEDDLQAEAVEQRAQAPRGSTGSGQWNDAGQRRRRRSPRRGPPPTPRRGPRRSGGCWRRGAPHPTRRSTAPTTGRAASDGRYSSISRASRASGVASVASARRSGDLRGRGLPQHRLEQLVPRVEVVVDQAGAHVELGGDVGDADVVQPALQGDAVGRVQDLLAPLLDADAGPGRAGHRRRAYRCRSVPGGERGEQELVDVGDTGLVLGRSTRRPRARRRTSLERVADGDVLLDHLAGGGEVGAPDARERPTGATGSPARRPWWTGQWA